MTRELTGRHVLMIAIGAFAVIIAANLSMLFAATGSFPGLVVKNSYVAGQGWDARAEAQRALGWSAEVSYEAGRIRLTLADAEGHPVTSAAPVLHIGRPTRSGQDHEIRPVFNGMAYAAPANLAPGRWRANLTIEAPARFTASTEIFVAEGL